MTSLAANATLRHRLDLFEQVFVLILYAWLVVRLWPGTADEPLAISLLLVSEGIVCVLLVLRRSTWDISVRWRDWVVAAAGTFLPLLVIQGGDPLFGLLGTYLILAGMFFHVGAKLSLSRSFGLVAANRGVKVAGMYSFVRHPMYAGYMLCHIGYLLAAPAVWNLVVYVTLWTLLAARIDAEERLLLDDPRYRDYARSVRYRLVPGVY